MNAILNVRHSQWFITFCVAWRIAIFSREVPCVMCWSWCRRCKY